MSEELKQAEPRKMGWFRKYVLMQDLREISDVIVNLFFILYVVFILAGSSLLVITRFSDDYQINLNELTTAKGQLHSYVYYNKKSRATDGVWYVELNGKKIEYYNRFYNIDKDESYKISQLNGESVEIQYIPSQNKFYLIKFNNFKFAEFPAAKRTLADLKQNRYNNLHKLPLYSLLSTLFFIIVGMLIIRYEIFKKPNIYFTIQTWNVASPIILNSSHRYRVLCVFIIGPLLMVVNLFIIADNFIWR